MKNTRDHISLTGWRLKEQTPANFIIYFISMKIKTNKYNFVSAHRQELRHSELEEFNVKIPEINAVIFNRKTLTFL